MEKKKQNKAYEGEQATFFRSVTGIALPVALQSLLQSSFGAADQLMIGQLGSASIAGVGLGGKFASLYSVLLGAVSAAAGIVVAQCIGKKAEDEAGRSLAVHFALSGVLAFVFVVLCGAVPETVMRFYTGEMQTRKIAAGYLRILALSYLPMAAGTIAATLLRCIGKAVFSLYASLAGVLLNTGLNYVLIFGKLGWPQMGSDGAALATVISQTAVCAVTLVFFVRACRERGIRIRLAERRKAAGDEAAAEHTGAADERNSFGKGRLTRNAYLSILAPILICEFLWSLGENVYAAIYGNMGTAACAAMTLTIPVQTMVIGMLSGLSQAAGILVGRLLGSGEWDGAYAASKKLMQLGLYGSLLLSVLLAAGGSWYVSIYRVEPSVKVATLCLLLVYGMIAPVKVQNMILGGGILRSGGATRYVMWIDMIGTWLIGVPLGLLAAFVWKLPIASVYFFLSLEEIARLLMELYVFRKKVWMRRI